MFVDEKEKDSDDAKRKRPVPPICRCTRLTESEVLVEKHLKSRDFGGKKRMSV